ncbi:MAG: hypothetical protein ACRDYD_04385 [Acidimicrobiales bacterium]
MSMMALAARDRSVDLSDPAAVRTRLHRAVFLHTLMDLGVPLAAGGFVVVVLIVAWAVVKHAVPWGSYFAVPIIISVVGMGMGGAMMGPWWLNRHPRKGGDVVAEPDATVSAARVERVDLVRPGLLLPGGPPSLVGLVVTLGDGRHLAWSAQVRPRHEGLGAGQAHHAMAVLGNPQPGRWLLGIEASGGVVWPMTPAVATSPTAPPPHFRA